MNITLLKLCCLALIFLIFQGMLAPGQIQTELIEITPLRLDTTANTGFSIVEGCENLWKKYYSGIEKNGYAVMKNLPSDIEMLQLSDYGKRLLAGVNSLVRVTRNGDKEKIHIPEEVFRILGTASCLTTTRTQMADGFQSYKDGVYFGIPTSICITESHWSENLPLGRAGEKGVCQLIPTTYDMVNAFSRRQPTALVDSIFAATNKLGPLHNGLGVGMGDQSWVKSFTGVSGVNAWNQHPGQARETYSATVQIYNYEISLLQSLVSGGNNVYGNSTK